MQQLQLQQAQIQREQARINDFWNDILVEMNSINPEKEDFKTHELPLARIKKIMRLEDDVAESGTPRFMIAAEAPIIIAKACEIFVLEMAMRANSLTAENKRRTLQRNDIAMAVSKTDTYDFLIDIVPREEIKKDEIGGGPSQGDMEAQHHMQLMAMQHALGAQMQGAVQDPQLLQQAAAGGAVAEGNGAADANGMSQAALQQQQEAMMAAVATHPQLAMQMQMLWQQHAQQAMFLQQQQQQQQQQREGRGDGAAAMGVPPGAGVVGQGEPAMDQANAVAAMQSAMMSNPAMLQAFMGSIGGHAAGAQLPPQQQQQQQQQNQHLQQQAQQQQQVSQSQPMPMPPASGDAM